MIKTDYFCYNTTYFKVNAFICMPITIILINNTLKDLMFLKILGMQNEKNYH